MRHVKILINDEHNRYAGTTVHSRIYVLSGSKRFIPKSLIIEENLKPIVNTGHIVLPKWFCDKNLDLRFSDTEVQNETK